MPQLSAKLFLLLAGLSAFTVILAEPFEPPIVHEKVHRHIEIDQRGRYTETVERVTRIVSEYGVDFIGHHVFEAKATQESLKVLSASDHLPNGKEIHLAKDWIKKSGGDGTSSREFDDKVTTTIVFPQVEIGSRLRSKYKLTHFKPEKPGEFDMKFRKPAILTESLSGRRRWKPSCLPNNIRRSALRSTRRFSRNLSLSTARICNFSGLGSSSIVVVRPAQGIH
jgi:hypothetical protein